MIGAGGASRAVLQALIDAGFRSVVLLNRTVARAEALARHFGGPVEAGGLDLLSEVLPVADLIINATSAGLHDGDGFGGAVESCQTRRDRNRPRLRAARDAVPSRAQATGLTIVDGLGMLLHQAVPGFERWFGVRPTVDAELRALIVADIEG